MKINEAIKHYRVKCGMTQLELDIATGLRPTSIQRYERWHGLSKGPNYQSLAKIVKVFLDRLGDDFDLEVFFGFKEPTGNHEVE